MLAVEANVMTEFVKANGMGELILCALKRLFHSLRKPMTIKKNLAQTYTSQINIYQLMVLV